MKTTISLVIFSLCLPVFLLSTDADARSYRKSRRKHQGFKQKKKVYKMKKVKRKKRVISGMKKTGPAKLNTFSRFLKESERKRTEERIRLLKELLGNTEDTDEEKPKLYFELAELYYKMSKYFDFEANRYDDYKGTKSWAQKKPLQQQARVKMRDFRQKAVNVYRTIIKKHQNFKKLCMTYYFLGKNLFEMGKQKAALREFSAMLSRYRNSYPGCPFIPDAYLAFGEYYFNNNSVRTALKRYQNVLYFKKSRVYGYAMYKIAWCHYNLVDYPTALKKFVAVVQHAKNGSGKIRLLKEALRDMVITYSQVKNPSYPANAERYFLQVGGEENYIKMLQNLGIMYRQQGKFDAVITIYSTLIRLNKESPKTLFYQLYITQAVDRSGNKSKVLAAVRKLGRLIRYFRKRGGGGKIYKNAIREIKAQLREFAKHRHYIAQKTQEKRYYRQAQLFYSAYLDLFPKEKDSYTMRFWYAELLYKLNKLKAAAKHYRLCVELNPKGKFSKDAAFNTILVYDRLMKRKRIDVGNLSKKKKNLTKRKIPPVAKGFLGACNMYIKYFPKDKNSIDVSYKAALLFYKFNHLNKALPQFYFLVKKYPKHKYAVYAAFFILDTFKLQKNWRLLSKESWRFYRQPGLGDAKFKKELRELIVGSGIKICEEIKNKQKDCLQAAKCFYKFSSEFPDKRKLASLALYNAASNYFCAKMPEKALQLRHEFLDKYSKTKIRPKLVQGTILNLANLYSKRANFSKAAGLYEEYASKYSDKKRIPCITQAALFREAMGETDKAIKHYRTILGDKKYKRKKPKEFIARYLYLTKIFYEQGSKGRANYFKMARTFMKKGMGTKSQQIFIRMQFARLRHKLGFSRSAKKIYKEIPYYYKRLKSRDKKNAFYYNKAREAMANIVFMQAEEAFKKYTKVKFGKRMVLKAMEKRMKEKEKLSLEAVKLYKKVTKYSQAEWTIAAFYRIGKLFQNYANFLYKAPMPDFQKQATKAVMKLLKKKRIPYRLRKKYARKLAPRLVPKIQMKYQDKISAQVAPYEDKAVEYFNLSIKASHKTREYNKWSDLALIALQKLRPSTPRLLETPPKAGYSVSGFAYKNAIMGELDAMPKPRPKPIKPSKIKAGKKQASLSPRKP